MKAKPKGRKECVEEVPKCNYLKQCGGCHLVKDGDVEAIKACPIGNWPIQKK